MNKITNHILPEKEPEQQTIAEAFVEHKSVLFSYFARKLLKPEDIEDLLHDTFMIAFKSEAKQPIKSPKGYLFVVARNLLSKKFARENRLMVKSIDEVDFDYIPAPDVPADQALHYKVEMEALIRCIEHLPDQCRRVFIYKKFHGMSQKQIAAKMKISTSTVERHITIALVKLRVLMKTEGHVSDFSGFNETHIHSGGRGLD